MKPRRIVCAAIQCGDVVVCGARHFDMVMHGVFGELPPAIIVGHVHGFIDNDGVFLTRGQAYIIAESNGQIRHKTDNPHIKELYSEDLY